MIRVDDAPSAVRIPISRVRRCTKYANTLNTPTVASASAIIAENSGQLRDCAQASELALDVPSNRVHANMHARVDPLPRRLSPS